MLLISHNSFLPSQWMSSALLRSGFLKWPPQIARFKVNPVRHVVSDWINVIGLVLI